jgi:hypothetical protein
MCLPNIEKRESVNWRMSQRQEIAPPMIAYASNTFKELVGEERELQIGNLRQRMQLISYEATDGLQ